MHGLHGSRWYFPAPVCWAWKAVLLHFRKSGVQSCPCDRCLKIARWRQKMSLIRWCHYCFWRLALFYAVRCWSSGQMCREMKLHTARCWFWERTFMKRSGCRNRAYNLAHADCHNKRDWRNCQKTERKFPADSKKDNQHANHHCNTFKNIIRSPADKMPYCIQVV